GVWLVGDLQDRAADLEPRPGWEVCGAEIQIQVELIAGERPAVGAPRHQSRGAGIHQVELHVGVRLPVGRAGTGPSLPAVAEEASLQIERGGEHCFPLVYR